MANTKSDQILAHLKGLRARMREGEEPLFSIPAIWENATERQSNACDLVLTNQRLFGYIYTTFPRERLFLDTIELNEITVVSIRHKNLEAMFRELFVSDGKKRIYIRATRKKIEEAYTTLCETITQHAPATRASLDASEQSKEHDAPIYSRQEVRQSLERSPLGITILLVGGLLLEIIGVLVWIATASAQTGVPLLLAGIIAVIVATIARRQLQSGGQKGK